MLVRLGVPFPRIPIPMPYWVWRLSVLGGGRPPIRLHRLRLEVPGLAASLDGLRGVFLTDLHLGPCVPERYLCGVLEQAVSLKPDLFLLGGDFIDRRRDEVVRAAALLRVLSETGRPVLGVLGNHDWWSERGVVGAGRGVFLRGRLGEAGVTLIDNARVWIDGQRRLLHEMPKEGGVCVAGLGDLREDRADPAKALEGVPEGTPTLLLAHNPDSVMDPWFAARPPRVSLMLCGHTHGGQCVLPLLGAPVVLVKHRAHARGMSKGPGFPVLTSNGVGVSSLPVRWGCPPEMHEVTLHRRGA